MRPRHPLGPIVALLAVALVLPGVPAGAQGGASQAQITLSVDRHIASVGEPMQVTVSIVINGRMGYERYFPPTFTDFQVSGGGMTSQNIEVINWNVRRNESHTYTVIPLKAGTLKLGPAAVQMAGRRFASQVVAIKVRKGALSPTPAPGGPGGPDEPDAPDAGADDPALPADGRPLERVFLTAQATPQKAYLGQQIAVTWYLYTQSTVLGFQTTGQPTTDKFWSEDLDSPRRLQMEQRVVQNRLFYAAVIARKALFPQQVGKLTVGPMSAQLRTMDQFAGAAVTRRSEALEIEVMPLPEQGKPAGFPEQNVGQFDMMASLDRTRVKAGEGVTFKLVIRGKGNLRQVKPPALDSLDGFKVYQPKVVDQLQVAGAVSGEKIVEYLLLPTRGGQLRIPALTLDYFDPDEGRYKRATTDPVSLQVVGKLAPEAAAGGKAAAKNVIGPTIRPPRPPRALTNRHADPVHRRPLFVILFALPVALLLGVAGGERLRSRLRRETPGSLRRAATRRTRAHMGRAAELRDRPGQAAAFYAEIAAGLRSLLDHTLGISIEGLTRPELRERMGAAGFPAELADRVTAELDACDTARFAPSAATDAAEERGKALARVRELLDRLSRVSVRNNGGGAR